MTTRGDQELIASANRGDESACEQLYERYRDWVYSQALKVAGNADDAADVLQEVFFYFFGKFPGFELRCQLKTFLYPAVRNIAIRLRDRRRRLATMEEVPDPVAPRAPERPDLGHLVAALPEAQREIVLLRFGEDLKLDEIASRLDIPLGTVKSRLHKGLATLREHLDAPEDG